jgi:RHS repeat-associated protein
VAKITFRNGVTSAYEYDDGGRVTRIEHKSKGLVLASWSATYDSLDQWATATVINPLVPLMPASGTSLTYATNNQLVTADGVAAVFDADGNYLGESAESPCFTYDVFNRVSAAAMPGQPSPSYAFDPDGLRVMTKTGGATNHYVFDINSYQSAAVERGDPRRALTNTTQTKTIFDTSAPAPVDAQGGLKPMNQAVDRLLELRDSSQNIAYRFLHGLGVVAWQDGTGAGSYCHCDPSGNLWLLTNDSGKVTNSWVFGAYGQVYAQRDDGPSPYKFSAQFGVIDDGNGLLNMRARSYCPAQMRFLQQDYLLGRPYTPQSFNQYGFTQGNPLQASDPLGLDDKFGGGGSVTDPGNRSGSDESWN